MPFFVYILKSTFDGSYYVGPTVDIKERLNRHNQGRSTFTKSKRPWCLIYQEKHPNRSSAMKRESQIKNRKSRAYIETLIRTSHQAWREGRGFESRRLRHEFKRGLVIPNPFFIPTRQACGWCNMPFFGVYPDFSNKFVSKITAFVLKLLVFPLGGMSINFAKK